MNFIDLDRMFAPLSKDKEATLEGGATAGRKYAGWLNWSDLLQRQRVVLLAEALSGKTQELTFHTKRLKDEGKHAFFVRIEELADSGFQSSLDEAGTTDFGTWKATKAPAWFFLDSVDEARVNRKNFGLALRRFAKELGRENLGRAHAVVTCRASDWHGKGDRELIKELLPVVTLSAPEPVLDPDEALLAPIFTLSEKTRGVPPVAHETQPADLLVVQLVPLTVEQKSKFVRAAGVADSDEFLRAVGRSGLVGMTERPGDLVDLIGYWNEHRAFGSLRDMTDAGVQRKLTEEDTHRGDADQLTSQRAREGAERLAAALVLGKSFTLRAAGQEPETDLAQGAIEPLKVLPDWSAAQVTTLLRRGLFAPATYGRVRFHHRSSQEFLAASWLRRLLAANCPLEEVRRLLFVDLYAIETVRPALRSVAAWLSLAHPAILSEVTRREPVCLIAYGDPKSLPITARERLLKVYAQLDAKGDLNPEMIDYRAVWMFSDPELATAIRDSWNVNERPNFRLQLLRFIEEAPIPACADLARAVALDPAQDQYSRMVAARALLACDDTQGLERLAANVRAAPDKLNANLAPEFGLVLYPTYLNTVDLLELIDRSQPARRFQVEGFAQHLDALHRASPDRASAQQLAFGLGEMYLSPTRDDEGDALSRRHSELGKGLAGIAQLELDSRRNGDLQPGMVRLLMAVERVSENHGSEELLQTLSKRVQSDVCLNRALMWADAQVGWMDEPRENPPIHVWQIGPFSGHPLWGIGPNDVDWLIEDSKARALEHERRVAFSALYKALFQSGSLAARRDLIEALATADPVLQKDLRQMEAPLPDDPYVAQREATKLKRQQDERDAKQSWKNFRDELYKNPGVLDVEGSLKSWKAGLFRLHSLTRWLTAKVGGDSSTGPRSWRVLGPVFGDAVAEHYCSGMRLAWRHIRPERPVYHGNGSYTTKHTSILALQGLAIDSAEEADWTRKLTSDEVRLAAKHVCYIGDSSADWFQRLVDERSAEANDVVQRSVAVEYASEGARMDLLVRSANGQTSARFAVAARVFQLLQRSEPADQATLDRALQILKISRYDLPPNTLRRLIERRLREHLRTGNEDRALGYFALHLLLAPDNAANHLCDLLMCADEEEEAIWRARTQKWLGALFGDHHDAPTALTDMSVPTLLRLVKLLYSSVLPHRDGDPQRQDAGSARDAAEHARQVALNALLARPGAAAFRALQELAADPTFLGNSLRLRELAHSKAETDGDLTAWSERDVVAFEQAGTGPAKTGADLMRLVMAVLSDIAASFDQADASSRSLLQLAQDEDQVQTWLAERLNERSKDRFHAHREPKVANRNEPDIVVSSASAIVEVAIEVKNGNKKWTVSQLEGTLSGQLARDYLRTTNRRHGILVISLHTNRTWKKAGEVWSFERLIDHLRRTAAGVTSNETGFVEVSAFALDARARPEDG